VKCPVGIELSPIRMIARRGGINGSENNNFSLIKRYFPDIKSNTLNGQSEKPSFGWLPEQPPKKADVLFFAGCMTHLTPSIKASMTKILDASGVNWSFMDEEGGICCGRPLMLAGQDKEARELINLNSKQIWKSGAHTLVTSCPICYKIFKESYYLDAEVLHHTQFIKRLIDNGSLKLNFLRTKVAYRSPCELGRGSGVYDEPKEVLQHVARLQKTKFDDENSLCCGGSLGNIKLDYRSKSKIASFAANELTKSNPDVLATACPLCKKSFSAATITKVSDISEIVAEAIFIPAVQNPVSEKKL
jgi:Fe-S oxidoreductase